MSRPLSLPRGLGKCFIHLCRQMLQMLQFLLGKSRTNTRGFFESDKNGQLPPTNDPPRKVFFKMCFIEKRVTNSQAWDIFWGVPWKPKGYPKIQSSKPDQRDISPCHPPQILSFRCCHDHCFQNLTSGSFRWLLAKREGSSPCLFESLVNLWEIHKSFVMAGKIRFKSPYK